MSAGLSSVNFRDVETRALATEVDEQLRALVTMTRVTVEAQYTEPMYIALDNEPFAILAARVRNRDTPETVVAHGLRCSFVYEGEQLRARIDDIDGMSTGATFYVFDFLVVDNG